VQETIHILNYMTCEILWVFYIKSWMMIQYEHPQPRILVFCPISFSINEQFKFKNKVHSNVDTQFFSNLFIFLKIN